MAERLVSLDRRRQITDLFPLKIIYIIRVEQYRTVRLASEIRRCQIPATSLHPINKGKKGGGRGGQTTS